MNKRISPSSDSLFMVMLAVTAVMAIIFTVVLVGAVNDRGVRLAAGDTETYAAPGETLSTDETEAGPVEPSQISDAAPEPGAGRPGTAPHEGTDGAPATPVADAAPVAAAAGNPTYPGSVIKVGGVCSLTGPIYYGSSCKSAAAYFNYLNEQGGVNGITFDYRFYDDGVDQQRNLNAYRRLVEEDKVLATVGSAQNLSFLSAGDYLESAGVPLIGPAYANKEENRPNVFPLTMWVADFGGQPADYFVNELGKKAMCIVYANIFPARNALRQTKWLLRDNPDLLRDTIAVSITEPDYSGVVVRFQSAGCDSVLTFIDPASVVRYIRAAKQQGFNPPTIIPIGAWTPEEADAAGDAGEGLLAQIAYDLPVTGNPEAVLYAKQLERFFPGEIINAFAPGGWVAAKAFADAVARIDGEVTRDKLVAALNSMHGWDPGLAPPVNIGQNPPTKAARLYVQKNGDWVPATDFFNAPAMCPDCLTNDDVENIPS